MERISRHYFITERVDGGAVRDDAARKAQEGETSKVHFHKHGQPCSAACLVVESTAKV